MVTGKPPRRSTPSVGPVTIDLDAKDINPADPQKAEAETVQGPPTGDQTPPATPDATENSPVADAPEATAKPADDKISEETVAASSSSGKPVEPPQAARETMTPKPSAAIPAGSTAARKPATSSYVASGIFGGLVALALAGSMQYAGYLPPFAKTQAETADIASLVAEIDGLKQQITNIPVASAPVEQSALEARLAALESSSAATGQAAPADTAAITALEEKIVALQTGLEEARATAATSISDSATLSQRLDTAEKKLNEPRDDVEVARAIASAALKATIDRGGPFLTELETLAGVVPDDPAIAGLRPLAAAGVPSRAELLRQYPDVATTILEALHQPDPNEGVLDRLKGSALSLVRVRPVGNVVGESPDAVVARIEDKMRNGDLEGASLEWNQLPEAGKAASAQFKQALDARISVEDLVNGTLQRAVTSTGQKG